MKKTKIVCTIGPASESEEMISALIDAGMNVGRINLSHGSHEGHREKIDNIKKIREAMNKPVAILLDTKGPEVRLKDFAGGTAELIEGQNFALLCSNTEQGNEKGVGVSYEGLWKKVSPGNTILIDDGKIRMEVESVNNEEIISRVIKGGKLGNRKGVNVPGVNLDMEYLSEADRQDLMFGVKNDVDFVAASFVGSAADVNVLRSFLDANGGDKIKIISKIESVGGVDNFEEILDASDGIMVARGDMGVEIDYERLPGIQKRIIRRCCEVGKPVITATQMLESMIESLSPTRAEITDVANAVYDGTSAVMLSGETTIGKHPVETVLTMSRIITEAEKDPYLHLKEIDFACDGNDVAEAVGQAACSAAKALAAKAILAVTRSGYTAERISKYRPAMPVVAATPNSKTFYQQALTRGVEPVLCEDPVKGLKDTGIVHSGDRIVICSNTKVQAEGNTNFMMVETI